MNCRIFIDSIEFKIVPSDVTETFYSFWSFDILSNHIPIFIRITRIEWSFTSLKSGNFPHTYQYFSAWSRTKPAVIGRTLTPNAPRFSYVVPLLFLQLIYLSIIYQRITRGVSFRINISALMVPTLW